MTTTWDAVAHGAGEGYGWVDARHVGPAETHLVDAHGAGEGHGSADGFRRGPPTTKLVRAAGFGAGHGAAHARTRRRPYMFDRLYHEGEQTVQWVPGYTFGEGQQSIRPAHLELVAVRDEGQRTWVTLHPIDLTPSSRIRIRWAQDSTTIRWAEDTIGDPDHAHAYLVASPVPDGDHADYTARMARTGEWPQETQDLNVAALQGAYHIRVHVRTTAPTVPAQLNIQEVSRDGVIIHGQDLDVTFSPARLRPPTIHAAGNWTVTGPVIDREELHV